MIQEATVLGLELVEGLDPGDGTLVVVVVCLLHRLPILTLPVLPVEP